MPRKKAYEPALMKSKNWNNRIVDYGEENPEDLLANPLNWRVHPKAQQVSLTGVLDDIGFIAPVIVNRTTGHMIDGHLRVSLSLRNGVPKIPVVYVELSPEEESEALVTLDPIANMAVADMQNLESLIGNLGEIDDSVRLLIGEILHESNKKAVKNTLDVKEQEEDDDDGESAFADNPFGITKDAIENTKQEEEENQFQYPAFHSDNEWGVPMLDMMNQNTTNHQLIERWGRIARHNTRMTGMWHFYTDDYKFSGIWKNPDTVIRSGCMAAVEPNFSTSDVHSKAEMLYNIWRKRWLARYWQNAGVKIVVDLNVIPSMWDYNLLGVPKRWKSYATRWYAKYEDVFWQFEEAKKHAETDDIQFFVFATKTKDVEEVCREKNWIHVRMDMNTMGGIK